MPKFSHTFFYLCVVYIVTRGMSSSGCVKSAQQKMLRLAGIRQLITCTARRISNTVITNDPELQAIWKSAKPFKCIPGPKSYPLIGALLDIIQNDDRKERLLERRYFMTLNERFGPIVRLSNPSYLGGAMVGTDDPEVFKLMLRNESKYPSRNSISESNFSFIHNKIKVPPFMAFTTGPEWKKLRSALSKPILPRKVAMLSSPLSDIANELGDYWLEKKDNDNTVHDITDDLQKWALKGVSWFIFNKDINVFDSNNEEGEKFTKAAANFVKNISLILEALPLYKVFPTKPYKNYVNAVRDMHKLGESMMKARFDELQDLVKKGEEFLDSNRISVMEYLLIDGQITKEEALSQACDLLAAGVDTTSVTATYLLHHIAQRPDIQQDLFDEINKVCGEKETIDFADLQKLSLVRNCVKETLRLHPVLIVSLRVIESDMVLNGYQVPKGTCILYNFGEAGKNESIYPNYQNFDPYRWNNKEQQNELVAFTNIPFGFGVRMCYGRRLAELELHLLLVNLVRRFIFSTDQTSIRTIEATVIKPGEPVRLEIKQR